MKSNNYKKEILGLILLFTITFCAKIYAQVSFQEHIITTNAISATSVYAVDIDEDGDNDVLSASSDDDKIAWYKNTDGQGTFGPQQIISTNADEAMSVFAVDLDGDGDIDVLSASSADNKIAWYKNTDGQGTFGTQQIISTNADEVESVYAADIDGDGDMDVLSASAGKIAWYKNTNGLGNFGTEQIISTNASDPFSVYATDIDGDGDVDVISTTNLEVFWNKNIDGHGTFGQDQSIASVNGASSVYAADFDGDGDLDVVSGSVFINTPELFWCENIDGHGTFSTKQIISTTSSISYAFATDVDGDGDQDVLSASTENNKIAWYENTDGLGSFGSQQIISSNADGASFVYAVDIDNDGDQDVLTASSNDNKIAWYENIDNTPVNDACSGAFDITIQLSAAAYYTNRQNATLATNNTGFKPTCGSNSTGENGHMNDGVWYTFNALYDGEITVYIIPFGSWDAELGIYTDLCNDLVCLNSADNNTNGGIETLTFPVVTGKDYFINVGHWMPTNDGAEGPFDIIVEYSCGGTPPVNDLIANAIQVTDESFTDSNINIPCSKSEGNNFNGCGEWSNATHTVFYKFEATHASTVTAIVSGATSYPVSMFFEAPNLNAKETDLTHVNQTNNQCGFQSTSSITTQAGHYYYLVVSNGTVSDVIINGVDYSALAVEDITALGCVIYPNPVTNTLHLKAETLIDKVTIYSILGQEVLKVSPDANQTEIDMSQLATATYIVKVTIGQKTGSYHLIKTQ